MLIPIDKENLGLQRFAGVDEVGRGPLAGPVIAAAVILDPAQPLSGLADSKLLSEKRRNELFTQIQEQALAWAIGRAEVAEIDSLNILQASLLAMQRAVQGLNVAPERVLVDGSICPYFAYPAQAIVKGDQLIPAISAASILAKVIRDNEMRQFDAIYPGYDFATHKGYPTKLHLQALRTQGVSPIHRRSFKPVRDLLADLAV